MESNATKQTARRNSSGTIFNKKRIIKNLDNVQDFLVVLLLIALLIIMALLLYSLFSLLQTEPNFKQTIADLLFLFVLLELFRLMMIYLDDHHISIGVVVEVTLVSVMREVIVVGIVHMSIDQILGVCAFIVAVSTLLWVEAYVKVQGAKYPEIKDHH